MNLNVEIELIRKTIVERMGAKKNEEKEKKYLRKKFLLVHWIPNSFKNLLPLCGKRFVWMAMVMAGDG